MTTNRHYLLAIILSTILICSLAFTSYAYQSYQTKSADSLFEITKRFNTNITTLNRSNNI